MESRVGKLIFLLLSKWNTSEVGRSAFDLLRYPQVRSADFVTSIPALSTFDPRVLARVDIDGTPLYFILSSTNPDSIFTGRYAAHLRRQQADLRLFQADESLRLQPTLDYAQVAGLSSEERERLTLVRPASIVSSDLSMRLIAVTSAAGRGETNGRNNTGRSRRIAAARKENICGASGLAGLRPPGLRKCAG